MKLLYSVLFAILTLSSFAQIDSVYYHDYSFESQYGTSGAQPYADYSRIVTRFTPPYYPAQLVGIKAWFRNSLNPSSFNWVVYIDTAATATGPIGAPAYFSSIGYNNPAAGGVTDSAYSAYTDITSQNIIVNSGDVYAGVTEHLMINPFIGIAADDTTTFPSNRFWVYASLGWTQALNWTFTNEGWGINAYFTLVTTGINSTEFSNTSSLNIYPTPSKSNATISYNLKVDALVSLIVYNAFGKEEIVLSENEKQNQGTHNIQINTEKLSSGIYFCHLISGNDLSVKKLVIIK